MKFPNYLKNVFAGLGVLSLIFYTCASESTSDDSSSNLPQITGGTYQVSNVGNSSMIVVLNTESGVMKTYFAVAPTGVTEWRESDNNYPPMTFTH